MRKFIKKRLRLVLEAKTSHTPSNPTPKNAEPKFATDVDFENTLHKITKYNNEYGQDPYFQNPHEGDGTYIATIHINGNVTVKTPNQNVRQITDDKIGLMRTGIGGSKQVLVKVCRGIEHPEFQDERKCTVRTKSPANDAAIKVYMMYGKEILEYVNQNMEGYDAYTSDSEEKDFKSKTDDKWKYKYDKYEKEKQRKRNKKQLSLDPEDAADIEKKQARLRAKYGKK